MKTRIIIILSFLLASVISLYFVYFGNISQNTSGVLANLGTGFIGTAITVLIVDWLYERRSADEETRNIALSVLLEFDHAIWVWQGGSRGLDVNELYSLIHQAGKNDPLPYFTQNLFMRLGSRCVTHLNLKGDNITRNPKLFAALRNLSRLELIRDGGSSFSFDEFREILRSSAELLSLGCGIGAPQLVQLRLSAHRPSSEEHQHFRHFGRQLDGTQQPLWFSDDGL